MMIAEGLTLDQVRVFLAVADAGSFSAAARALGRAQSAVSYAIQQMEAQVGAPLFDRAAYRPALSAAGKGLLARARRLAAEAEALRLHARALGAGVEAELSIVVDAFFPMPVFIEVLTELRRRFPTVSTRIYVEALGAATKMVLDGDCTLGLTFGYVVGQEQLAQAAAQTVQLVRVAAPVHPLARLGRPVTREDLGDHVQLVLTDRSAVTAGQDFGVYAAHTWRVADLHVKHAMLLAGLGWGGMPRHMIEADIQSNRLVLLVSAPWEGSDQIPPVPMSVTWRSDTVLGPAAQWLRGRLCVQPI